MKKINKSIYGLSNYFFLHSVFGKKLLSYLIKKGKKQKAEILIYSSLVELRSLIKTRVDLFYLKKALLMVLPFYETRTYRSRGTSSMVTLPLYSKKRRLFIVFKHILTFLKNQPKEFKKKFSFVLFQILKQEGMFYTSFQKHNQQIIKQQYPKMHFRWS